MGKYDVALGREYESGSDATRISDSTGFYLPREWRQDSTGVVQGEPARPTDAGQGLTGPGYYDYGETGMGFYGYGETGMGHRGVAGQTGMAGATGMRGTTGLQGITGYSGVAGIQGTTGLRLPPAGSTGINFQMMTIDEALGFDVIDMDYRDRPANPGYIQRNSQFDRPRSEITILPADNPRNRQIGFRVYETQGIGIINPTAIPKHVCHHCGQPLKKRFFFFWSKKCANPACENWHGNNHRHVDRYSMALSQAYQK